MFASPVANPCFARTSRQTLAGRKQSGRQLGKVSPGIRDVERPDREPGPRERDPVEPVQVRRRSS